MQHITYDTWLKTSPEGFRVIFVGASWCNPCQRLKQGIKEKYPQYLEKFYFVDVDENSEFVTDFCIDTVPFLIYESDIHFSNYCGDSDVEKVITWLEAQIRITQTTGEDVG